MYCSECRKFFDEPAYEREDPSPSGVALAPGWYTYEVCPFCGNDYLEESKKCITCGEDVRDEEILCESCKADFTKELDELLSSYNLENDEASRLFEDFLER